jgi:LysR family tcuABC transcriptional regulator
VLLTDKDAHRQNLLASLSDDELSPAALACRVTIVDAVRQLVREDRWTGATLQASR